ncbi:MAG: hypothetical protein R3B45_01575 [Bdellovibrionota bacterium]
MKSCAGVATFAPQKLENMLSSNWGIDKDVAGHFTECEKAYLQEIEIV